MTGRSPMRSRFRPSPAMIVACIALFVALGGTATAVTYVVSSNSQVGPGTISGHKPPTGKHSNIIAGSDQSTDEHTTELQLRIGHVCRLFVPKQDIKPQNIQRHARHVTRQ